METQYNVDKNIAKVLNDIAKKYNYKDFPDILQNSETRMIKVEQAMQAYHRLLCEKAGRELPDSKLVPHEGQYDSNEYGAEWMKQKASAIIASQQMEIEDLKMEVTKYRIGLEEIQSLNKEAKSIRSHIYNTEKPQ